MLDLRSHFSRFLNSQPERLHFAAHSHHPWPDVTRDAQLKAWDDAACLIDDKWEHVLGPVLDEFRGHVARHLNLPDPSTIAVAPNTHEFLKRLLSCFPADRPVRILTSDGEFHSFTRQIARLEEEGLVAVTRIPAEPFTTFEDRFFSAAQDDHDLVFVSQVFFNSGFAPDGRHLAEYGHDGAMIVIDGYHGFMARPTDLSGIADRAFYIAGGYKYAMAGEGACFMHCPPGWGPRPRDTGWYAAFGNLANAQSGQVGYSEDGWRFMGATFDPSGLYRFNAVMRWLAREGITPGIVHAHAKALQQHFLQRVGGSGPLGHASLVVPADEMRRGNFLTFQTPQAQALYNDLKELRVVTDVRGQRLRIGFGIYQSEEEVNDLVRRIDEAGALESMTLDRPSAA
ncbi:selenocysteine lyase/cysteine desulfurase [Microvirga flocculans]|uniref:Selenocysteine lyase/cysteine desulfurase n=1 Tax=Microvirga flocculans TaxID=217168 RepID=A0A7W6IFV0_9HYPH|nr:aminotransferase class V-fold PLP-dependent enzyme [Microvirga flocculans]MBB4040105.1 selenocysteine lyase/cysteine desulfurase [Microvirga flocculans]